MSREYAKHSKASHTLDTGHVDSALEHRTDTEVNVLMGYKIYGFVTLGPFQMCASQNTLLAAHEK